MPQSTVEGRIVKRSQISRKHAQDSNQLVAKYRETKGEGRAGRNDELANHEKEIKYYYLTRRYTNAQLYVAMESIFKIGATPAQYIGYVNKCGFKKKLTTEDWKSIAAHCHAYYALGQEVAIKIDGCYTVEPPTVRKELSRLILVREEDSILREGVPIPENPDQPLTVGRFEVCSPPASTNYERVPDSILSRLPIWVARNLLLKICERDSQGQWWGDMGKEISNVANSNYFRYLRVLLYRLSNNLVDFDVLDELLDKVTSLGFRSSLKGLLSLQTYSVKVAAENLVPILTLRCDEDMIRHIFETHGLLSVRYYDIIYRLQHSKPRPPTVSERPVSLPKRLKEKYNKAFEAGKFLANIIERQQILPPTLEEAAILVASVINWGLLSITSMINIVLSRFELEDIEERYEERFGVCVLRFESSLPLRDILQHGFKRHLHTVALEAVLFSNFEKATDLLLFSEISFPEISLRRFEKSSYMWEILGTDGFSQLVAAAAKEQVRENREEPSMVLARQNGLFGWCITVACCLRDERLFTFILGCVQTYFSEQRENVLTDALAEIIQMRQRLLRSRYSPIEGRDSYFYCQAVPHSHYILEEQSLFEWCKKLADSGADINTGFKIKFPFGHTEPRTPLRYAIKMEDVDLAKILLRLGADPNYEDSEKESPINTLLYWISGESKNGQVFKKKDKFGEIICSLLKAGATIPADYDGKLDRPHREFEAARVEPLKSDFIAALHTGDIDQINDKWDDQFATDQYVYTHCENCDYVTNTFDIIFGDAEFGGWRNTSAFQTLQNQHSKDLMANGGVFCCFSDYSKQQLTPVRCLLLIGDEVGLLQKLLLNHPGDAKAEILGSCPDMPSVLQMAANEGRTKCLLLLLENGSDPRQETPAPDGSLALHCAIADGNLDIGRYLLEYGVNIYQVEGAYPYQNAVETAVELRRIDFVALFLLHSIECRGIALAAAEKYGHTSVTEWINDNYKMGAKTSRSHQRDQ
ncbi:hypothetical protein TWF718_002537 [Orbilia javanica]|uniref:Uncharacterized protein n=1 Tax=Orbilia javanica TaxID=47235 RepID=A0AAN8RJU3_9PEZI